MRRLILTVFLAGLAAGLRAEQCTDKFNWDSNEKVHKLDMKCGDVRLWQIEFELGDVKSDTPIRKSSAKAVCYFDNSGTVDTQVGVGLVAWDANGNMVAAGNGGTKWGYLNKEQRDHYTVDFGYLYRNLGKAKTLQITVETQRK